MNNSEVFSFNPMENRKINNSEDFLNVTNNHRTNKINNNNNVTEGYVILATGHIWIPDTSLKNV